jgi:hypothetical protein
MGMDLALVRWFKPWLLGIEGTYVSKGWYDEHELEHPEGSSSTLGEPCIFNSVTPVSTVLY